MLQTPAKRTDPNLSEDRADLIRSRIELRDGRLFWRSTSRSAWNARYAGTPVCLHEAPCGYRRIRIERKWYSAHRVIWLLHYGRWPMLVDHINRDRTDNRIENLREATPAENQWNSGPRMNNPSGYPGVQWYKANKRWVAVIKANGRKTFLGSFQDLSDAIRARKQAERQRGLSSFSGEAA